MLVVHYLDGGFLGGEAEHGLDEVFAEFAVEPGRADDDVAAADAPDGFFSVEFCDGVDALRSGFFVLGDGRMVRFSAKDVVGGDMHQQSVNLLHRHRQILHRLCIQLFCQIIIILRPFHIRIASTVHNDINPLRLHHGPNGRTVRNIQLRHIRKHPLE